MRRIGTLLLSALFIVTGYAQVPAVYSNLHIDKKNNLVFKLGDKSYSVLNYEKYKLADFNSPIAGTTEGLEFNFVSSSFSGSLYYGLIHFEDSKYPLPVFFKERAKIESGQVTIHIKEKLSGRYDMSNWESKSKGILGFRIADYQGNMLYEGRVAFRYNEVFQAINTIIEGPFVDQITNTSAIISLTTSMPGEIEVLINGKTYKSSTTSTHHEIMLNQLAQNKSYSYSITTEGITQRYSFRTAPNPGSRTKFSFAYASDSRSGSGGGERDMYGTNYYIMKKIMALANQQGAAFLQFSGDLIDGYLTSIAETDLQYANWKRAIEPWAHYMPIYEGLGNHEAVCFRFDVESSYFGAMIDKFPFQTNSAEYVFGKNFVNPQNGPKSEDNSEYDPNPDKMDFPSYTENVYHYSYDNIAVICLNSDYWYAPSLSRIPQTSGNLHGYLMDNQIQWLSEVLASYEKDANIDHVFVTLHTPAFPNGGHVGDDMWYDGNNQYRAWISGKPVKYGIIERRDHFLNEIVNKSTKVIALMTGDEHNYCRTTINESMPRYPQTGYSKPKLVLNRTIYQINNGAAGAPYYAQQETPWSDYTSGFTTQNALVLFHINGKEVELEVLNPDTLEEIERFVLRD